ncbi:MAG: chitobiase/beta-hexosaminidase C-terminal domain-containing protein [Candidatus Methanoperedens sp.]
MRFYLGFVTVLLITLGTTDAAGAANELPFKRMIDVNSWGDATKNQTMIDKVIEDVIYMNGDAIMFSIESQYFEAVRDPSRASWDSRASWNMLEYAIAKAHENNIQLHVWIPVNIVNSNIRAEYRMWGTNYSVVSRDGVIDSNRRDPAYIQVQDYEVGLIGFIANHYPTLDGIHIEEPFYNGVNSYSPAMRDRVKAKFSGYDIITQQDDPVSCVSSLDINICPTKARINLAAHDIWYEFFVKIRTSFNANKSNPNLLLSANAANYYRPVHGFDPENMSDNHLLDWYVAQTNANSLSGFKSSIEIMKQKIDDIPVVPESYITWSSIYPETNPIFIDQVSKSCEYGGSAEKVFAYFWRNKIINGTSIKPYEGLHNLPPSLLCGKQSTIVSAPTFSISAGSYSSAQNISISTGTTGATIRYTKDGTTPVETSPIYSSPILISSNTTLNARAWKTGYTPSSITSASYTIATPVISPVTANYIKNPGFESGTTSWIKSTNANVTFSAVSPGYKGSYSGKLAISSINTNIQLYQTGIPLEPNRRYKLSFAAYSTTGHDLQMKLIKGVSPYPTYGLTYTADLNTTWQTFTTEFSTSGFEGNVTDGRMQIWIAPFAAEGDTYNIDDLQLEKVNVNNNIYDLNKDNVVDVYDMNIVYFHYYEITTFPYPNYDINTDGQVDIFDMIRVSSNIIV